MKKQALFSSKDKSEKLKCRLLQFLFGALRLISNFSLAQTDMHVYNTITDTYDVMIVSLV